MSPLSGPLAEGVHTLQLPDIALRYHVHGTGPVCLAHPGGPGIEGEYLRAPELEQHLTMVYVEPAGTGGSTRLATHPHGYTRELHSRHLAALIAHLPVHRVHLLGHSYGGFVAQYHAVHRPERIAGVVLYESAPVTGPEHGEEIARQMGVRWAEELHRLIPGARLLIPEHSGHFGHLEEPEPFAREVAAFVAAGNA
ncbi:alpha/beta fold hydrolase [Streptomyces sp. NRRL S-448]|uniref:alpha/beta fold hydrolase n=1 Tax=Streptomyces sp. NRRL S-448 TaxID=1463907 RepID=UPI000AF07C34